MNAKTRDEKRKLLARFKTPTDLELKAAGIVAEVRRPPVAQWVASGEVPESLFNAAATALGQGAQATSEALKLPEMFGLALRVARASFVWPRLTEEGQSSTEDEDMLDPATLPMPDLADILGWALSGSPNVPVQTTDGEVSHASVKNFHDDESLPGNRAGDEDVRPAPGDGDGDS
jgi:hypothetical protein